MTLEELRQLKEKTDNLLFTFQNDRQILQEEKKKREEKISKDFGNFILSEIKEYSNLAYLDCEYYLPVLDTKLLEEENLRKFEAYVHHNVCLAIQHKEAKEPVIYNLTKDTMNIYDMAEYKKFKSNLQKSIFNYSEKVKETLTRLVEFSLDKKLKDEKKINDNLFNQIKDLEK